MDINRNLAGKLMDESPSFREYILNTIFDTTFREDVVANLNQWNDETPDSKIKAVKFVRALDPSLMKDNFPLIYREPTNSLRTAKEFVERFWDNHDE